MDQSIKKPSLQYYTIKVEIEAPMTLTYRVLAASPDEALERLKYASLSEAPKPHLEKMRKKEAKVYKQNDLQIQASKKY